MKIVVSVSVPDLDTPVEPRFGRAAYFLIIDSETLRYEAIRNPNVFAGGGAGTRSAQLVLDRGAEVILTGNVGPNARRILDAAQVQVVTGVQGTIREAVQKFVSKGSS